MNYPIPGLGVIAPIIFFVLLAVNIITGVFGGWKRSLYWGGGNFVFYCIGLGVWAGCKNAVATKLQPLIQNLLHNDQLDFTKIIQPIAGLIFFFGILLIANLILLICWLTFAKKLLKIKSEKKAWKDEGALKKQGKLKEAQLSARTKKGVINKVCGGVAMTALMAPSLLVGTSIVSYATTSVATRQKGSFIDNFHSWLVNTNNVMGGFSYVNGAGEKFDALFSGLNLINKKITVKDENDNEVETDVFSALEKTFGEGVSNLTANTSKVKLDDAESIQTNIVDPLQTISDNWNAIIDQAGDDVSTILSDGDVTEILKGFIDDDVKIQDLTIDQLTGEGAFAKGSTFDTIVDAYIEGKMVVGDDTIEFPDIQQLPVGEESYNNIVETVKGFITIDDDAAQNPEALAQYNDIIDKFTSILFTK